MAPFARLEHQAVAKALLSMDHDLLMHCHCWFGGGTEIVLDLGEYRLSKDIDFLCANADGYREMRSRVTAQGTVGLFGPAVREVRAFRSDQYGIRGIIEVADIPLRVEIIREARVSLSGRPDRPLGVPRLGLSDRVTEKMLANADRCQDRATSYRDAIDLGMLTWRLGPFPASAVAKAEHAYGEDVRRKLVWVLERLATDDERLFAATTLGMDPVMLAGAVDALRIEVTRHWPAVVPGDPTAAAAPLPRRD